MKKGIAMNIKGLICDNPHCDYKDDTIKSEDYAEYIGFPCPKCGESLLTQEDYEFTQKMKTLVDLMGEFLPEVGDDEQMFAVEMRRNKKVGESE